MKKKIADRPRSQLTRCAIYARTATVKQASEDNSIAQQIRMCKRFAKRNGWIVSEDYIFTDSGKSGLTMNSGLKDLLHIAGVSPKSFDVLLCTEIDRVARDANLVIRVHRALRKRGIEIQSVEIAALPVRDRGVDSTRSEF